MTDVAVVIRKMRVWLMAISLAIPGWASAAQVHWVPQTDKQGFVVMEPEISLNGLVKDISRLKIALRHDEKVLAQRAEDKEFTDSDKVLSFLMPGGLFYAAYKKSAHDNAVREHDRVAIELAEISTDLVQLMTLDKPVLVAAHH